MEQLVIGRELPNLKITLAGLEAPTSNSNVETDVMEIEEDQDNKTNEEENCPNVKVDVKLEFMSYKGMKRYENKQGSLATGLDLTSKELQEKLEKRAKRFQIESRQKSKITQEDIEALYKSLNITTGDKASERNRGIRLDAIHIRGVCDMSTDDIFAYFAEYGPSSIEWINDVSCNVVWLDKASAARALLGLSRPLILHRRKRLTVEDNDNKEYNQEEDDEEKYIEGGEEVVMMSEDESSDEDEDMPVENLQNQESNVNSTLINNSEENATVSTVAVATSITTDSSASSPVTGVPHEVLAMQEDIVAVRETANAQENSSVAEEDPVTSQGCISAQGDIAQNTTLSRKEDDDIEEDTIVTKNDPSSAKENSVTITMQKDPVTITPPESPVNTTSSVVKGSELEEKVDEELPLSVPPGYWRLGVPHPKAKVLLLRFATKDDKKIRGAEKRSIYYKKYGNPNYGGMKGLISNSRKRRFWQLQQRRELQQLGIKNNEISQMDTQNDIRRMESTSSGSESDDVMKPLRRKLRMKMYADEEENKQKRKKLHLLRYNRNERQMVTRKKLRKSVMVGSAQNEDSDSWHDDKNDMVADNLQHSSATVWERLTNLDENSSSDFEETSDLRKKLRYRGSNVEEWMRRSMAPITGDLRGKLDQIRNKQYVREHRSPLLIHVANDQSD